MKVNLNRIFKLNIRSKLAIAFTGLSLLPIVIVGLYVISTHIDTLREIALEDLNHDLLSFKERAENFLSNAEGDIRFLGTSYLLHKLVEASQSNYAHTINAVINDVEQQMLTFAQSKGIYYQIKYLNSNGDELFCIEAHGEGYSAVPEGRLNTTGTRYYFLLAQELQPGRIAFIPAELLRDDNTFVPAISCVFPVVEHDKLKGILITNIFAKYFFQIVESRTHTSFAGTVMLVSKEGFYLYHSEKKKEWNKLLASRDIDNLKHDYPSEIVTQILSGTQGTIEEGVDQIISYAPLLREHAELHTSYTVIKTVSKDIIFASVYDFKKFFIGLIVVFLITSLGLSYLATTQFIKPISALHKGAEIIARGKYDHRLNIKTYDEIERLAEQFNAMAQSIQERETEIRRHKEQLEQMVAERTRELTEEKNKLQAILDNLPSAFILLDKQLRILSASSALKSIAGYVPAEVIGKYCYQVLPKEMCMACSSRQALESGEIAMDITVKHKGTDEEQYIEHISVPLRQDGQVESILEVITDITEREHLKEQLIRSEKLATTGEMAAVIAHEIRNSLTSVKMILQLQLESEMLAVSDKESLEVAIDSIYRMESIVNDLLHFSRPTPVELKPDDINRILEESIAFSQHQFHSKGIQLVKNLSPRLPHVMADAEHLKEAFVNLILNASQAIDGRGVIEIVTDNIKMSREMKEYYRFRIPTKPNVVSESQQSEEIEREIVLLKGTPAIRVQIKDTGCGIPKERLKRIFDPFFTTKINGTGLGLSLVKRIISEHGGIISVKSEVGKGTTFSIYLPLA